VTCSTICIKQFFTFTASPPVVAAADRRCYSSSRVSCRWSSLFNEVKEKIKEKAAPKNNFLVIELWLPPFHIMIIY
jgi:hypothetical protein